jgi:methionyl-tRNA formyltransferase
VKKRVIFCTYSSVYSSLVLEQLLTSPEIEVVAIINSTRVLKRKNGHLRGAIQQINTTGWRYATYLFLITDGFSLLQPFLMFSKTPLRSIHRIAKNNKIPLYETRDINERNSVDFIQQQSADVLVAAHFNQLVKPVILELTQLECLNIHPSLLPAYKGVDPVFYSMLNNESEIGVTLHKMAEAFDTGEILLQEKRKLSMANSLFHQNYQIFLEGAKLVTMYLQEKNHQKVGGCASTPLSRTTSPRQVLDKNSSDQYDSWPSPEKNTKFKNKGGKLINIRQLWDIGSQKNGYFKK